MIIGAQKAGTTSLKNYLGEHPALITHQQSEFGFFRDTDAYSRGFESAIKEYFPDASGKIMIAKNAGMYYEIASIKRLKEHNPDCKIVFLLREPVARLISAYKMEKFNGWIQYDPSEFVKVIVNKDESHQLYRLFIRLGHYSEFLEEIVKYFSKDQIMLVDYDSFHADASKICTHIFEWLKVDATFQPDLSKKHNESKKAKSKILTNLIIRLRSPNNVFKVAAKKILPSQAFAKIGNRIIDLNKSKQTIQVEINSDQLKTLREHYQPYNKALEEQYDFSCESWKG